METETITDTMVSQVLATKSIIKQLGQFMDEQTVNQMCQKLLNTIKISDRRKELNVNYTAENEAGEDEIDVQNRTFMEEENKIEDELQLAISETFGSLFMTHQDQCGLLVKTLFDELLPVYLGDGAQFIKKKFALFVIVDLVEHLGLGRIDETQFAGCFSTLLAYSKDPNPVLRQACNYGFGIIARVGGTHFQQYSNDILEALRHSIEMSLGTQDKDAYNHARDNAISSLGKVLEAQSAVLADPVATFDYFVTTLPIDHDNEEAKEMNEFLANALAQDPKVVLGENFERLPKIMDILGKQLIEEYMTEETQNKFRTFFSQVTATPELATLVQAEFAKLSEIAQSRFQNVLA